MKGQAKSRVSRGTTTDKVFIYVKKLGAKKCPDQRRYTQVRHHTVVEGQPTSIERIATLKLMPFFFHVFRSRRA
jgi:hypothetical protein